MKNLIKIIVISLLYTYNLFSVHCETCQKEQVELKQCSGCQTTYYCSQACQKSDWKRHKKSCIAIKAGNEQKKQDNKQEVEKLGWSIATAQLPKIFCEIEEKNRKLALELEGSDTFTKECSKLTELFKKPVTFDGFDFFIEEAKKFMLAEDYIAAEIFAANAYNSIKNNDDEKDRISKSASLLVDAKMAIISAGIYSEHYGARRDEVLNFLNVGAKAGNKNCQALLALSTYAADSQDFSYIDDEVVRADLERHAENPEHGFHIKVRLAFEFYIKTNHKKAHKILDQLLASKDLVDQTLGSIGKLMIADLQSQNFTQIKSLLDRARAKYLESKGSIPVPVKYDFAVLLDKHGEGEKDFELVNKMLEELAPTHFLPATYFTEERNQRLSLRQLEKPEEELFKEEVPETKEAPKTDTSVEKKVSHSLPPPKTVSKPAVNPIIAAMSTAHMVLTSTAQKDLNKLINSNNGQLPFDPEEISEVAEDIITSKGQCGPKLAKKIRGTETFWRSWLGGRDYRMDWQYEKQSDGKMKINIRHIRPKKDFTYGF